MVDSNVNVNHVTKQKKKKNLSNEKVYGSLKGVVEMHSLGEYEIEKKKLKVIIKELVEENETLNERVDNTKKALGSMLTRLENIERKMKNYGLE